MSYFRIQKEERFTQVDNRFINDPEISAKAKGILLYLLSKPNDWKVYEVDVIKHMKDGRDSIRSGIKELVSNGYIHREQSFDERGKFAGYQYSVYEYKEDNPFYKSNVDGKHVNGNDVDGKHDDVKHDDGKPETTNTKSTKTNSSNTNVNNTNTTNESGGENETANNPFAFFADNIGVLTPHVAEQIEAFIEDFTDGEAIVVKALEITVENQKRNFGYAKSILNNWYAANVRTEQDLKSYLLQRRGGNNNATGQQSASTNAGRYTAPLPDSFNW